jgi:flagella basal body P-ring formation protein FlgA
MKKDSLDKMQGLRLPSVLVVTVFGLLFMIPSQGSAEQPKNEHLLKIHLPREVSVKKESIRMADIGILGGSEYAVLEAGDVALGKFSVPGQEIVIERATILSRLASHGYPSSKVTITGSLKVNVVRQQSIIKSSEFVESGRLFLNENPPLNSICEIDAVSMPKDLVLPSGHTDVQLICRLLENNNKSQANVRVGVFSEGKEIATRDIKFRFKFNYRKAVAVVTIPAGSVINSENIKIEKTVSNYPEPTDWKAPYGLVAKRTIPANSIVDDTALGATENIVVIERNQTVTIRAETQGLLITALGTSLQKGQAGEYIRVRNNDSKRIIFAKVCEDGTVKPVF